MTRTDDNLELRDDDQRLDLLVDGELSEADRRALLLQLDHVPDGWRRCALAFLQAQCWKQELGPIARSAESGAAQPGQGRGPRRKWPAYLGTLLAMAASFLLALMVGQKIEWGRGKTNRQPSPDSMAMTVQPAPQPLPFARPAPDMRRPLVPGQGRAQMVTFTVPQGPEGRLESFRLPAVERNSLDRKWLEGGFPAAVPVEVLRELRQSGHAIEAHRELVPIDLNDGRRLVVPVDQVDVQFIGRPAL
jgi:hypothetical protein